MAGKKSSQDSGQSKLTDKPREQGQTAEQLAKKQREVGVAEFFARNKHLLGFDNPRKALLTTIKEAVDNSLDACEEAGVAPEVMVEVIEMAENRFRIIVEDNGPGIVRRNVGKVFAKLLYGSKFHTRKQQRGQQGIGISAAVMYAQLTTGRPAKITSRTGPKQSATYMELTIDTARNEPKILIEQEKEWKKEHGTRIEIDIEATYQKGPQSVDEYLKQTAVVNPHATIIYVNPKAEQYVFARATEDLPRKAQEILPHPHGIEIGTLIKMLAETENRTLNAFLENSFSRVSSQVAKEICEHARIPPGTDPRAISRDGAEALIRGIGLTKIMAPPTDCLSPIGAELLEKGLKKEVQAEFYTARSRDPIVVKGNPFQVEVALAYGGQQDGDKAARLMRFANRVPLLYQQGGCGTTAAVTATNWKAYNISQPGGGMPIGALTIVIHIAAVWVPYTSESKEAIADEDDIVKEIKLALQDAGRELGKYLHKKHSASRMLERANLFERFTPEVASALSRLTGENEEVIAGSLNLMIQKEHIVGKMESLKAENTEYDEEWVRIGKDTAVDAPKQEADDGKPAKGKKKDGSDEKSKAERKTGGKR